jgi:hypothetical protein
MTSPQWPEVDLENLPRSIAEEREEEREAACLGVVLARQRKSENKY